MSDERLIKKIYARIEKAVKKAFKKKPVYPIINVIETDEYIQTVVMHKPRKGKGKVEFERKYKMPLERIEINGRIEV